MADLARGSAHMGRSKWLAPNWTICMQWHERMTWPPTRPESAGDRDRLMGDHGQFRITGRLLGQSGWRG
jgi:hypothetical protein